MCLAVPGKVLSVAGDDPLALHGQVDFAGVRKEVSLAFTPEVKVGEYVLVHVGFALSVVDEDEAQKIFATLAEMDELAGAGEPPG
jgi:hydrogenase expression/formation protein HypC